MSTPTLIYFLAILFVGVPAALRVALAPVSVRVRNPTALAMVLTWAVCRLLYWATGEAMPTEAMFLSDMAVIGAMFVKDDWRECFPYRSLRDQFAALWHERTPWDQAILAMFPAVWLFYAPILDPKLQYWTLWGLSMVQLALAGAEGLHQWRGTMAMNSRADAPGKPPPRSLFAPVRGEAYG